MTSNLYIYTQHDRVDKLESISKQKFTGKVKGTKAKEKVKSRQTLLRMLLAFIEIFPLLFY